MGGGDANDDFPHSSFLADIIGEYRAGKYADHAVDLVFNGDTFDFLKLAVDGKYPFHITSHIALKKLGTVAAAHGPFFEAIRDFLQSGPGPRRVDFVVGNHDAELVFTAVQKEIVRLCGGDGRIHFPGYQLRIGPVHVEHGHQLDPLFFMDPQRPLISADPEPLLNLSWAAIGLLQIVIPMQPELAFYERLQPRDELMRLVPELTELFNALAWHYWTREFWRTYLLKKDPLLDFSWSILKQVIRRFLFTNSEVVIDKLRLSSTAASGTAQIFVMGHLHQLAHYWIGEKRIIQNGAMRDEYRILAGGSSYTPILKTWIEIELDQDERVVAVDTHERRGPVRPAEELPDSIFDLAPRVRKKLADLGDRAGFQAAQQAQEREESDS